jgi:hypothetical protein
MEAELYGYRGLCLPLRKRFRNLSFFVRKYSIGRVKKRAPLGCRQLQLATHSEPCRFVSHLPTDLPVGYLILTRTAARVQRARS